MGLLSFLKRPAAPASPAVDAQSLDSLRSRARRRLIGAAVLVLVGVVVLPLLFDTPPRPVAVDIPIEIPGKERVPPLAPPGKPIASGTLTPPPAAAPAAAAGGSEPAAPALDKPAEASTEKVTEKAVESAAPEKPVPPPEPARAAAAESARALAALEARPAPAKASAPGARYVVQVGAYSEAASAREARQRVEKLGLKTYTQVVETAAGSRTRVRVGPFEERAEADRTAAKIKQSGLPAAVLGL